MTDAANAPAPDVTLREKIQTALTAEYNRRAAEKIVASPEDHCAGFADVVMPIVDRELEQARVALARVRRACDRLDATGCNAFGRPLTAYDRGLTTAADRIRRALAPEARDA